MVNLHCAFRGCQSTTKLFSFPTDPLRARRWLQILARPDDTRTANMRVCSRHFSPECYANYTQAQMGFSVRLRLTDDAVPNPAEGPPSKLFREMACQTEVERVDVDCQTEPGENHVQCQTSPVGMHNASAQANRKPSRRSKAIQARAPNRSVSCDTNTLDQPLEIPLVTSIPEKRARLDVCDDSSYHPDVTESTVAGDSSSIETPYKMRKFIVYEDNQMQLYQQCPVCTWSFVVTTKTVGTLLLVDQSCPHCTYSEVEQPAGCQQNPS